MYIVYLDESGVPNGWNNQNHFVIGGIAVHEGQIWHLSEALNKIESKFFSDISTPIKFHATDINSGKPTRFRELPEQQRQDLLQDIYDFIASIEYPKAVLFATAIHITAVRNSDQALRDTFEDVVQRVNTFLVRLNNAGNPQKGLLIIDRATST